MAQIKLPIKWRIKKFNVRGQSKLSLPSYAAADRVTLRIILKFVPKDRLVNIIKFYIRHAMRKQLGNIKEVIKAG